MPVARIFLLVLLLLVPVLAEAGEEMPGAAAGKVVAVPEKPLKEYLFGSHSLGWADLDWETDLYYSNVSLNIPFTDKPLKYIQDADEFEIYSKLFLDSLVPRFMLIEAAVMPLPLVGAGLKEYAGDFYKAADVGKNQNVIQWLTAGFEEPWALSLFLGEVVRFDRVGESKLSINKGYMGYLLSYSNQHIKNNVLIRDNSLEAEWKLKGERSFKDDKLSWSFRLGAKIHDNPNITNTFYLGARRSNLDFRVNPFEFLKNSTFDLRLDFSQKTALPLRQEYTLGKKFPIKAWGVALKLDVGLIWEDPARYTGALRDRDFQNFTVVLRPNIQF